MISEVVAVDDSPIVKLTDAGCAPRGVDIAFKNYGPNEVYIGDRAVTDVTGQVVAINETFTASQLVGGDALYAVCAAGESASLRVLRTES